MRIKAFITVAVAFGAVAFPVVGETASGATAGSLPVATIVSPSADDMVSGTVGVSAAIDQIDPSDPVTQVSFAITSGSGYGKHEVQAVPAGSCVSSCTLTASFDTVAEDLTTFNPSGPIDALPDGPATFTVTGQTSSGATFGSDVTRTIDNHRPTLDLPDLSTLSGSDQKNWLGYKAFSTRVVDAPNPSTSYSVSNVELHLVDGPGAPVTWTGGAPAGGSGTIAFPLYGTTFPEWDAYAIAVDDNGVASAPIPVWLRKYYYALQIAVDSGVQHDGIPQIAGDAAHIEVVPRWTDGPTQTDTWLTSVSVDFDGRPVAKADGLHAFGAVPLDLHDASGMAFNAGEHQLGVSTVDNDGHTRYASVATWVVNPVSATWELPTTGPDTPTDVAATITDISGSAIHSIQLEQDLTPVGDQVLDPATSPAVVHATMSFAFGSHYLSALITLDNGNIYRVFHHLMAVESSVDAPHASTWGDDVTFEATATSSTGVPQSGVPVQLQSRMPGSTRWIPQARAVTGRHGKAPLTVPTSRTGNATWRVVSRLTDTRSPSTSPTRTLRVYAAFGNLPSTRSVRAGTATTYRLTIKPLRGAGPVALQERRTGTAGWTTLTRVSAVRIARGVQVRLHHVGTYNMRVVVAGTKSVTKTVSDSWIVHITR